MQQRYKQPDLQDMDMAWGDANHYRGRNKVGTILKQAREMHQLSVEQVSADIRVRRIYLQAIEDGRYDLLPGAAYAVGFVRIYADYLGLDTARLVDQFKAESGGQQHEQDFDFPELVAASSMPKKIIIALGVGVALIAILAYWFFNRPPSINTVQIPPIEQPDFLNSSDNTNFAAQQDSIQPNITEQPPEPVISPPVTIEQNQPANEVLSLNDVLNMTDDTTTQTSSVAGGIYVADVPRGAALSGWRNMANVTIIYRPDVINPYNQAASQINNNFAPQNQFPPTQQNPDSSTYPRVVIKSLDTSFVYIFDSVTDQNFISETMSSGQEYVLLQDQNAQITGATGRLVAILDGQYEVPIDVTSGNAQKVDYNSLKQRGIELGIIPVDAP